jgi:ferredoxin--NADP+ reductase
VARILARSHDELVTTDLADHALDALKGSGVREVHLLGRRGPAQAAFTNPEVKELGELVGADVSALAQEVELDPLSAAALAAQEDATTRKKLDILADYARRERTGKPRNLHIRFLVSPVEILERKGRVGGIRLVRNRLVASGDDLKAEPTGEYEDLPADLVFRSVGYRGVPIAGLPFDERRGIVPNERGRVIDPLAASSQQPAAYVSGWIKRGPSGVIGTNKPDAAETAQAMLEDAAAGRTLSPDLEDIEPLLRERQPDLVEWSHWMKLNAAETAAGSPAGRPRVRHTRVTDMLEAIRRGVEG